MEVAKLGECQVPATDSYFAPLKEQSLPEDRCIAEDRMMEKWRESTALPHGPVSPWDVPFHIYKSPIFLLKKLCTTRVGNLYSLSLWMRWLHVSLHMTSSDE